MFNVRFNTEKKEVPRLRILGDASRTVLAIEAAVSDREEKDMPAEPTLCNSPDRERRNGTIIRVEKSF